ncbi:hypothetical protein [Roseiconus lacunae]|uniref:Uncharacterized protein n=1 Tax=Roseiconus lacunae TaxID=2605694 RepID=A0ABT7PQ45_9BACT|nr:hypothetical protein [Roseiconus lacunae]MCD0462799.1 hypothetical protein [Roseiconus lacunae]MDM4018624.1 hypothetical protein [Roseiconus lacunae]WRQ51393.1 hypothetical protein U8335_02390 [Stieleria sp. HD01]
MAATVLSVALGGCASLATWSEPEKKEAQTKRGASPLRKIRRSIEVEAQFVKIRFNPNEPDQLQSMWQWVDETILPAGTRKALQANGLRVGKAAQPERLKSRLDGLRSQEARDELDAFLTSAGVASHQSEGKQTIPMRLGRRHELPVRLPMVGEHVVLVDDEPQPVGRTLLNPHFLFAITPQPARSPAKVRLSMRPEIPYGDVQMDGLQASAAFRIDVRRQAWVLDQLAFELAGGEGDLFVIAETATRHGLGRMMLGGKDVNQLEEQTIILLRVANIPTPAEEI